MHVNPRTTHASRINGSLSWEGFGGDAMLDRRRHDGRLLVARRQFAHQMQYFLGSFIRAALFTQNKEEGTENKHNFARLKSPKTQF